MLISNGLFLLIGCGIAALFVYLQLVQVDFVSSVLGTQLVIVTNVLMIAAGCLLLIAAIVGLAATRSLTTNAVHFTLLIPVILAIVTSIVCALVFKTWLTDEVRHTMQSTLQKGYDVHRKVTDSWDKAQTMWKCCSVDDQSWSIYLDSEWYKQQPGTPGDDENPKPYVPRSCCVLDANGQITDDNLKTCQTNGDGPPARQQGAQFTGQLNPYLQYRGCYQSAQDYLLHDSISWFNIVIGVGSATGALVLIGLCVSIASFSTHRKQANMNKLVLIDDTNAHMLHSFN